MAANTSEKGTNPKKCFIITPMGKEGTPARREMESVINFSLLPALEQAGGFKSDDVVSPFSFPRVGNIDVQIIDSILESDLIIANLTDLNPNVMYELAIGHFAGKPTILISRDIDSIPFDIKSEYVIDYTNDIGGGDALKEKIMQAVKNAIASGGKPQNIIQQAIERQVAKGLLNLMSLSFGHEQIQYKALRDKQMTIEIPCGSIRTKAQIYDIVNPLLADRTMEQTVDETAPGKLTIELKSYTMLQLTYFLEQVQSVFPDATTSSNILA